MDETSNVPALIYTSNVQYLSQGSCQVEINNIKINLCSEEQRHYRSSAAYTFFYVDSGTVETLTLN
ncbi:12630_t:CDS:2 [Funneliformis caledonium]|uniref:12630_t:CDS:1 n=1 Tax=Funneliformis caledonium TaxID=1117310 RepID=A0A9N8VQY1_9GLOM|nr:12630_t:CDS:2 [Funneliformis caledonium]